MPFALLTIGAVFLVASVRGTQDDLFGLIGKDFSGPNNFVYWLVAIAVIGGAGYIPKLKPLSTAFLVLVIVVLILTKGNPNGIGGGFFSQLTAGLKTTQTANASATPTTPGSATSALPNLLNLLP
jgi:hypothetical protein